MAYPNVAGFTHNAATLPSNTLAVHLPDDIANGDLVVVVVGVDVATSITFPAGWTELSFLQGTGVTQGVRYQWATGDIADFDVTLGMSGRVAGYQAFRVRYANDIEGAIVAGGSNANPDPPSLSPSWGADLTLWIAAFAHDVAGTVSGWPSGFTDGQQQMYAGTAYTQASCRREYEVTTLNPSAFTVSAADYWVAITIAIQGANSPPNAPANPTRTDFDARTAARFDWDFSDPDAGDTQGGFKLRIRPVAGAWQYAQADGTLGAEVWIDTANNYFDLDPNELVNGTNYEWEVLTKDNAGLAGPYCTTRSFLCRLPCVVSQPLPAEATQIAATDCQFSGQYDHDTGAAGTLRVQADTVNTFNSADLEEGTVSVTDGTRGTVTLTLPDRGTWYWRIRAESGADTGEWLATQTVERVAATIELIDPTGNAEADAAPMVFQARGYCDSQTVKVQVEFDTVTTFDGVDLEQQESALGASGTLREFSKTFTGIDTWYWRVRAVHEDTTVGDWSGPWELYVDTSGAVPTVILPDPASTVYIEIGSLIVDWSAQLDPVTTPTEDPSLRLQVQVDTDPGFTDPTTETSVRVSAGSRATASVAITEPGTYYVRFRTLADYGNDSDWVNYEVQVLFRTAFAKDPSWQGQIGPRPNRVYCRIEGGTTYQVAEVAGVDPEDKLDYWVTVPAGTVDAEALATAQAVLVVLQDRSVSVSGPVPITIVAAFDRLVTVQWWELVNDVPTLRETQTLMLAKKQHNVDEGTTEVFLGDYAPPAEETLARILAKLSRKS